MAKKPKKLSDDELASHLSSEIEQATGHMNSELSSQREDSMKYYLGEKFGNEIDGRSEIVTTDVRDTVEYIMPSLMRIFTTHNNVAEFEPQGPEDVEMAKQATDYCNYVFNKQNNGFKVLYDTFKDALISKTGIVKHFWEQKTEVSTENYTNLTEIEYQAVLANDELEVLEHTETLIQEAQLDQNGMMVSPEIITHDIKAKRTKSVLKIGDSAQYKRILTGSPITQSPMDLYAQCAFLDKDLLGFDSYWSFQGRYAIIRQTRIGNHSFQQIVGFRNLEALTDK